MTTLEILGALVTTGIAGHVLDQIGQSLSGSKNGAVARVGYALRAIGADVPALWRAVRGTRT